MEAGTVWNSRSGPRDRSLSGLWIAGIGFFVTRFTVTLAAYEQPSQFLLAGVVPLVLGLALSVFGIALVVGSFDAAYVRTVTVWCLLGTATMFVLVVLTVLGSNPGGLADVESVRSEVYLSTFLIGGAIGGSLTGLYAAQNRTHRTELRQQANRLVTLNRILRHEVINAMTIVRGMTETVATDPAAASTGEALDAVREKSDHVVATIDEVKSLTRTAHGAEPMLTEVDLGEAVEDSLATVREDFPSVTFTVVGDLPSGVRVWADGDLTTVLLNLLENAARYDDSPDPVVRVETAVTPAAAAVRIVDSGPGLPEQERAILERGDVPELDDPTAGFGTNVARMLVESYGGEIHTTVTDSGTAIEVALSRAAREGPRRTDLFDVRSYGIDRRGLFVLVGAGVVAGGVMGAVIQVTSGSVPVIGSLYGVPDLLVGWIVHEFHSVVFALAFGGLLASVRGAYADRLAGRLAVAVAWAVFLWLFASSIVMPVWFNLVGIPRDVPTLVLGSLGTHLIWGVSLALVYHAGDRWL